MNTWPLAFLLLEITRQGGSALGKTKRPLHFQLEYPFITANFPSALPRLSRQGKGKEMYCELLISFSFFFFFIVNRFSFSESLQKCYPGTQEVSVIIRDDFQSFLLCHLSESPDFLELVDHVPQLMKIVGCYFLLQGSTCEYMCILNYNNNSNYYIIIIIIVM